MESGRFMFPASSPVSVALSSARDCFADEVAIDFPSAHSLVERMRAAFLGSESEDALSAEISVSVWEASHGVIVPLDVPLRRCCDACGGRGELWAEVCACCHGSGTAFVPHHVKVTVPPGVADGARFSFSLTSRHAPPTRVDLRVAIR
jgi:hypothetical protein